MAYYLGYKSNLNYIPIDLDKKCSTDLLDLIMYTCKFPNLDELKNELSYENLIPSKNVELAYLIEKGTKGNKSYQRVPNLSQIYFCTSRTSFNPDCIRQYLLNNFRSKDLFTILYASYLKKVGVLEDLREYLNKLLDKTSALRITLGELSSILKTPSATSIIVNILESTDKSFSSQQIDSLIKELDMNNALLCATFNYLKRRLNTPFSNIIECLRNINFLQNKEYIDENTIKCSINSLIDIIDKESGSGEPKKPKTRCIVDIGAIIQDYKDYRLALDTEKYYSDETWNQDDDDYLEEEDFERLNTTSADYGIRLRIPDLMRQSTGENNGY